MGAATCSQCFVSECTTYGDASLIFVGVMDTVVTGGEEGFVMTDNLKARGACRVIVDSHRASLPWQWTGLLKGENLFLRLRLRLRSWTLLNQRSAALIVMTRLVSAASPDKASHSSIVILDVGCGYYCNS